MQLAYQAALHGVVDFKNSDLHDRRWQQHLMLRLSGLHAQRQAEAIRTKVDFCLADMQAHSGDEENYARAREATLDLVEAYCTLLQPWQPKNEKRQTRAVIDRLTTAWESVFGKLSDPETQRGIRETVEGLKAMRREKRENRERLAAARQKLLDAVLQKKALRQRQHQQRQRK